MLLNFPDVLDDIDAAPDQKQRLQELNDRLAPERVEMFQNFNRLTAEERRARFLELARKTEAGARAVLRPDQLARLRQIDLQMRGPMAFRDPLVVADLNLTAGQQDRIKLIEAERMFGPGPGGPRPDFGRPGGPRGPRFGPKGKGPDDLRRAEVERVLALLTDDQRARWRSLTGRPYVERHPFGGRFGPGPDGPPADR